MQDFFHQQYDRILLKLVYLFFLANSRLPSWQVKSFAQWLKEYPVKEKVVIAGEKNTLAMVNVTGDHLEVSNMYIYIFMYRNDITLYIYHLCMQIILHI